MSEIAYTHEPRPDSGLTNPALGLWLFLAAEAMLFASLLSAYGLLRLGSPEWPRGVDRTHLEWGALNTLLLVLSSVTMVSAWERSRLGLGARPQLLATALLGTGFLVIQGGEMSTAVLSGFTPSHDIASAIYFALSMVHALHLAGGLLVLMWLMRQPSGAQGGAASQHRFAQKVELTGIYWHFVDAVWLVLFPLLYLT